MNEKNYDGIPKVKEPLRSDVIKIRILIACGILSMIIFICWFIDPTHIGYAPIFWLLTFALVFKLVKMLHEWYHYWDPTVPKMPRSDRQWTVDVLTTACPGEPREMIIRTLRAMVEIKYPHTNYLCDEGNDPILKEICENLGVIHVTRVEKKNAKAGNINNALQQATGEIAVVLDPDHIPVPEFLDRVLPYFEDESIGYVQCVQGYYNQEESFIARGAAEQTYHFYGPMMMCMNSYGTVQAIGANCTFRRAALDSIGGHAAGLSEDMHTAMHMHAKGWRSIYVPEMLTKGLVPATLSAYYKQQLKWSRGTFDLLFHSFPKLYKNFTWRQKLHYFTIPLYFLFGLVNLIDIVVPIFALGLAEVPWELDLTKFGTYFVPLCVLNLCIRLYAQRWLLEEHEKGFHFAGGILRTATWWIFLIGFVYTIFNIKVPYIPTPKEDEHQNYIKLSVPNIIVFLLCSAMVLYGLSIDWTPYSILMASYSSTTICMMIFTVIVSQQKFIMDTERVFRRIPGVTFIKRIADSAFIGAQQFAYAVLKQGAVVPIIAFSSVIVGYNDIKKDYEKNDDASSKESGGFYLAAETGEFKNEKELFDIISFERKWKELSDLRTTFTRIGEQGSIPFFKLGLSRKDFEDISSGRSNAYLEKYVEELRQYSSPVFMTLTDVKEESSPEEYLKTWRHVYRFFTELGISNVTWIWCPKSKKEIDFYPGESFVDWIGLSVPDAGKSFSKNYDPLRQWFGKLQRTVMILDMDVESPEVINDIRTRYKEIRAVQIHKIDPKVLATITKPGFLEDHFKKRIPQHFRNKNENYHSAFVKGSPGKFKLYIHDQPYYIRGVAYNTAHDWRDGNMPLTRRQLVQDLTYMKEMGANTIRRYGHGIYDRNILNIAEEFDMNVLFGFWFDPEVDFFADTLKVKEYIEEVETKVKQYKDHKSIIAWSLGNESWGLLKHNFTKPYLTLVRGSYVKLIEHLAQRIHEIDPTRPVFSCMEHEEYQLPGELVAFRDGAPSVDVMGINSYYREQISRLKDVASKFDPQRPYLVSEFGPNGYWNPKFNATSQGVLLEQTDDEKAEWYKEQWKNYVLANKGYNIGGFAYCWHDRLEGSYTWFGLTDFKGRPKPSYYALKEQWTNKKEEDVPMVHIYGPNLLKANSEYTFSAVSSGKIDGEVEYEWKLLRDDLLDPIKTIEEVDEYGTITLKIPKDINHCKLYLFVNDKKNNRVLTSSLPLKLDKAL